MDYIKIGEDLRLTLFEIEEMLNKEIKLREDNDDGSYKDYLDIEYLKTRKEKLNTILNEIANYYIEQ